MDYFDSMATRYDELYFDSVSLAENAIISDIIRELVGESTIKTALDLGCSI